MTRPSKPKSRAVPAPAALHHPAVVPPLRDPSQNYPHEAFDRAARSALGRLSGGVSPHAFFEAWSDWAQHLAHSPGRQMELAEHAKLTC